MLKSRLMKLALLLAIPLTMSAAGIPAGVFAGTWKADLAKCQFPGPPPQLDMVTIRPDGHVTVNEITPAGKKVSWTYLPSEGKPVKVNGRKNVTVTVRKVDDHTTEQTWNSNGKTSTSKATVSEDGKTQTFEMDGVDKNGQPTHEVVVYDKQ
ncbi:MAG: hypothetical protein ABI158_06330 [Edaphobacter sp.]